MEKIAQDPHYIEDIPTAHAFMAKALYFATLAHEQQRRKTGDVPYIKHPIGVANYAINAKVQNPNVIVACYLHDVVEDTFVTIEDIEEHFGPKIAKFVAEVTDDKNLSKVERKKGQIEHSKHISKEAKIVKLCDKLYNLKDLVRNPIWEPERVQGYFVWSYIIVNNMRETNKCLEDQLDEVFNSEFFHGGKKYPVIPCDKNDEDALYRCLEDYYKLLENKND